MPDLVQCYNLGCGKKFDPANNSSDACLHHPGVPKFHDASKSWTCCGKRSTDFSTFLSYPGCKTGPHSDKKVDAVRLVPQTEIRPEKEEEVIVWNGLNEPDERPVDEQPFVTLTKEVSSGLQEAIKRFMEDNMTKSFGELNIGTICKNKGCKQTYNGPESNDEECVYHPGIEVFHEGMKFYSCCERKTSSFEAFLDQAGCTKGRHLWIKEEKDVKVKEDWFSRNGEVHINIYCKNSMSDDCHFEANGFVLRAKISHGFGTKETEITHELFGKIDPNSSKVQLGERKVEIVLKQASSTSWPRLSYDVKPKVDGDAA